VRWLGRVDARDQAAVKFAWSGTGLSAAVEGSKIAVKLRTDGGTDAAFFQPVVDGTPGARFRVPGGDAQSVVLAEGLASGVHRVELYRESEGNFGYSTFLGFAEGRVVGAPAAPRRLLEIIGDSISVGYGSLGRDVHPPWDKSCQFSLETESVYVAYSALLGRMLDAEVSVVARSGWGIYRGYDGNTSAVMSALYGNTLGSWPEPAYDFVRQPDAVIINLGTNDSAKGDPGQPYEDNYVALLGTVRGKYPRAWIFLTIGPMTGEPMLSTMRAHIDNVVQRVHDPKIVSTPLDPQDASTTGCDYHPDIEEHQRIAEHLAPALKERLGW
jgi:lysophospholipase L1-like esterase